MSLSAGTRLGPYEILSALGSGGMGEVYRARDRRLDRDVAIKIVPQALAADPERIARFEREAKTLAALNCPNIAHVYGLEESDGVRALAMELVEGPTLAERIATGPIPIDESLTIARQLAGALEAAHEQGIIHRDLKPANIKVRDDGVVKVLDFGLAKALEPAAPQHLKMTQSPTITTPVMMTGIGVILGTAAYMSPEQAKGRPADKRADIWAFGCVLYEMLSGRLAFQGDDIADTLATVLKDEPEWRALAPDTPAAVRRLLRQCLRKDPSRRLQAIGDARIQLDELLSGTQEDFGDSVTSRRTVRPLWRRTLPVAAVAIVAGGLGAIVGYSVRPPVPPAAITRFTHRLPDDQQFTNVGRHFLAISPDGTTIVYVANQRLYRKGMRDTAAMPIPGTDSQRGVTTPVFAPDGQSIVYFAGALKKVGLAGGSPVTLCPADNPFGMSWDGDSILFGQGSKGILRVSANGGTPDVMVRVEPSEAAASPQMLPGGRAILYTLAATAADSDRWDKAQIVVQTVDATARKTIIADGADARYVPTGHIVYAVAGVLFAVPFDARRLQVTGGPFSILEGVARSQAVGAAQFAFSRTGSLLHVAGPVTSADVPLDVGLLDHSGNVERMKLPPRPYYAPRISPNGRQLAVGIDNGKEADIWVYDLSGASAIRRLSFGGRNRFPAWTPDSQRVVFQSDREGDLGLFWQLADGTGSAERLTKAEADQAHVPASWSSMNGTLLFDVRVKDSFTLWALPGPGKTAAPFDSVSSINAQPAGTFSPDGRWVAYATGARGQSIEIYVQPFPPTTAKFLIGPGTNPFWSPDGKTLYYSEGNVFLAVDVRTQSGFSFGTAAPVRRPGTMLTTPGLARNYEMAPDGNHFVVVVSSGDATSGLAGDAGREIHVALNWFEDLKARTPAK